MGRTFIETIKVWLPSWLGGAGSSGTDDEKVAVSLATMLDDYVARAKWGLLARFPGAAVYLDDEAALASIGRDRGIVRGINEPATAYAERLTRALDDQRTRGNPFALLRQLRAYLQADCVVKTVDRRGNWYQIGAGGVEIATLWAGPFDWDGAPLTDWSRFWVIIHPVNGTDPWAMSADWGDAALFGDGLWGHPELTIGTTATVDQVAAVRSIIRDWKPANAICEWVIVAFDPASFSPSYSPGGTWGTWGNHTGSPVRLSTARYWKGPS